MSSLFVVFFTFSFPAWTATARTAGTTGTGM